MYEYIWLDQSLVGDINVPSADLVPSICFPLTMSPLIKLVSLCKILMKHNFISSLLTIAGSIMALHYTTIAKVFAGCPIVVCMGPSETGKTTALRSALSLIGMCWHSCYYNT